MCDMSDTVDLPTDDLYNLLSYGLAILSCKTDFLYEKLCAKNSINELFLM